MDPILEQKTKELYSRLTKARALGIDTGGDDGAEKWMRDNTDGKYGVADAQGYVQSLSHHSARNIVGSLAQGATYDFQDELFGVAGGEEAKAGERLRDKAYSGRHPWVSGGLKFVGALTAPVIAALTAPALAPTSVAGVAALGAGAGALTALGASEDKDIGDAAIGAGVGGVLGPLATKVGSTSLGAARTAIRNVYQPEARAIARAGRLMPEGLEQQAAYHERLAPGSFMPAAASEEAAQAIGPGIGINPRAVLRGIATVRRKLRDITAAKEEVGAAYDDIGNAVGPMRVDDELRDLLRTVNERADGPTTGFDRLQKLRTYFREKATSSTHAEDKHTYGQARARLTEWMEHNTPDINLAEVDHRFAFLAQSERNAQKLLETLERGNLTHGKVDLFGGEAGSIGGHLPAGARGMASTAFANTIARLTPGKAARAQAIEQMLVEPADASRVGQLARSYDAARAAPEPQPFSNFAAPTAVPSAIMSLFNMLSNPVPEQLQGEQQ